MSACGLSPACALAAEPSPDSAPSAWILHWLQRKQKEKRAGQETSLTNHRKKENTVLSKHTSPSTQSQDKHPEKSLLTGPPGENFV